MAITKTGSKRSQILCTLVSAVECSPVKAATPKLSHFMALLVYQDFFHGNQSQVSLNNLKYPAVPLF